jgi:hypothetical protein
MLTDLNDINKDMWSEKILNKKWDFLVEFDIIITVLFLYRFKHGTLQLYC